MNSVVILFDHLGYSERYRALVDTRIDVFAITAAGQGASLPDYVNEIQVPDSWMPESPPKVNRWWYKPDAVALAGIHQLGLDYDFYWLIEYDCCATQDRWKALFQDPVLPEYDGIFVCPKTKVQSAWAHVWGLPFAEKATHWHIFSICGLSAQAIQWLSEEAENNRNTYGELVPGSTIVAKGGKIASINVKNHYCNGQTMKTNPDRVLVNRNFINHPIKSNTYEP